MAGARGRQGGLDDEMAGVEIDDGALALLVAGAAGGVDAHAEEMALGVVPVGLAPELVEKAQTHAEWEEFSRIKLSQGGHLRKYYPLSEEGRAEYDAWKEEQGH